MKKANVLGWYGHLNIGDEAYKVSIPKLFPNVVFQFSDLSNKNPCDISILGGGNILSEEYVNEFFKIPARQKLILSVSANKKTPFAPLKQADLIWVRDQNSYELLMANDIYCKLVPDVATCLAPDVNAGSQWIKEQFKQYDRDLYNQKVGIVLNAYLYHHQPDLLARDFLTLNKVVFDLSKLADNTSASFIFFPMCTQMPSDDRITNSMIAGKCKFWKKNLVVYDTLSVQQTLDLISACDVVITSRLHSTIFSLISNVPFIDILHHDKNRNYLETITLNKWGASYWSFSYEEVQQMLNERLQQKEKYKSSLRQIYEQQYITLIREAKNVYFV